MNAAVNYHGFCFEFICEVGADFSVIDGAVDFYGVGDGEGCRVQRKTTQIKVSEEPFGLVGRGVMFSLDTFHVEFYVVEA